MKPATVFSRTLQSLAKSSYMFHQLSCGTVTSKFHLLRQDTGLSLGTIIASNKDRILIRIHGSIYFPGQIVTIIIIFINVAHSPSVVQFEKLS